MKKFIFLIIALVIIAAVAALLSFSPPEETAGYNEKVSLFVLDEEYSFDYKQGITAFDLLNESGLELETKQYDIGLFIESIDSVKNGQDGKYWLYYVNNQAPSVAADKMNLEPGDRVEFRFEDSPF